MKDKVGLKINKQENMSKLKKILLGIGAVLLIFVVIQIINAAKYSMVVQVVEGENIMGINPLAERLDFGDLSRNNGMTRYVTFKSSGGTPVYIAAFKFGEISDLVKMDKNFFTLNPGEEMKISFEIKIPPSAEFRHYSGSVWIFRIPKFF